MERALQRTRAQKLKNIPLESVSKSVDLMKDIDTRMVDRMGAEEQKQLINELDLLLTLTQKIKKVLEGK